MWEQVTTFMQDQLNNNELFKGGLLLMVGGGLLAVARSWPSRLWAFTKRQSMVVIDIPDRDPAFEWVNKWLAEHNYGKNRARLLTVKTIRDDRQYSIPKIIFSPAPGTHWLWFKRRLMILSRTRQSQAEGGSANSPKDPFREYFTIRLLGRDRKTPLSLIKEAYTLANPDTSNKVSVYRAKHYGDWGLNSWMPKRAFDSVILPKGMSEQISEDVATFLEGEDWYTKCGIPYRRGYLFYGPPGTGKTSAVMALASHFNMDIAMLNLSKGSTDDDGLADLLSCVPNQSIVLLEDVDCVVNGRTVEAVNADVTFSGLLNAIDGVGAPHGQMVFMTTNYIDQLDKALIRPGRCDITLEFKDADDHQKALMFKRFFPESSSADEFAKRITTSISMAEVQQHIMQYRQSAADALEHAVNIGRTLNEQTKTKA